jgi:hypothetical protein
VPLLPLHPSPPRSLADCCAKPQILCFFYNLAAGDLLSFKGGRFCLIVIPLAVTLSIPDGILCQPHLTQQCGGLCQGGGNSTFPLVAASVFGALSRAFGSLAFACMSSSPHLSIVPARSCSRWIKINFEDKMTTPSGTSPPNKDITCISVGGTCWELNSSLLLTWVE